MIESGVLVMNKPEGFTSFDVIGKLFEPEITDTRIVKSFRDGFMQHSLPSWLIDHGQLATVEKNTSRSLRLNEVMDAWIENRPPRERAIFVDELFEALDKAGVTDFSRMTLESLADTMLTLRNASETTRDILSDLGSRAFHVNELELPQEALPVAEEIQKVIESAGSEETRKKRKAWIRRFREEPLFRQSVLLIPTGILLALISESLINGAALILLVALTILQGWLTSLKAGGIAHRQFSSRRHGLWRCRHRADSAERRDVLERLPLQQQQPHGQRIPAGGA